MFLGQGSVSRLRLWVQGWAEGGKGSRAAIERETQLLFGTAPGTCFLLRCGKPKFWSKLRLLKLRACRRQIRQRQICSSSQCPIQIVELVRNSRQSAAVSAMACDSGAIRSCQYRSDLRIYQQHTHLSEHNSTQHRMVGLVLPPRGAVFFPGF